MASNRIDIKSDKNAHHGGVNQDVEHRGLTVHVQTEDLGAGKSQVRTLVYAHGGQIVFSKVTAYQDLKSAVDGDDTLHSKLLWQHLAIVNGIKSGKIDAQLGF